MQKDTLGEYFYKLTVYKLNFSFDNKKVILQAAGQERYGTVCDQV